MTETKNRTEAQQADRTQVTTEVQIAVARALSGTRVLGHNDIVAIMAVITGNQPTEEKKK